MSPAQLQQTFMQALQHHQAGQLAQAEPLYRQVLAEDPQNINALHLLGVLSHQTGRHDAAVELIGRAVALKPTVAEFHNNLGLALQSQGKLEPAAAEFRTAISLKPDYAVAHNNLGSLLKAQGQMEAALASFRRALQLKPDYAEAHNNLGNALQSLGKLDDAVAAYKNALRLNPSYALAYNNLGNTLRLGRQFDLAVEAFNKALQLKPDFAEAHLNLGNVFLEQGRLDQAAEAFRAALRLRRDFAEAHANLGNALKDAGLLDEAIAAYRQALTLKGDAPEIHSNLLYVLQFHPAYDAQAIFEEAQAWDRRHGQPLAHDIQVHDNQRDPERPLRIGYVAADFRRHPVGQNFLPLALAHDRRQFQVACYSNVRQPDDVTQRLRGLAAPWRDIVGISDEQVAQQIRGDRIDILVDLSMHMAYNRLQVFARKPAPIQVTGLCSMGTTGLAAMDYRLSDRYSDPPGGNDAFYSEKTIRLPDCYFCHEVPQDSPPVGPVPALRAGYLTFGSLHNFSKITPQVLALWGDILGALPESRLILRCPAGSAQQRVGGILAARGIAASRVEFIAGMLPGDAYHRLHDRMDMGLDPFPYSGHTTSLDALWMGVPLITLAGSRDVGRSGVFLLNNVGLEECIAPTEAQYLEKAVALARDLPRLSAMRAGLRQRVQQSPLMDGPRFTRHVEAAYREMWRAWCAAKQYP